MPSRKAATSTPADPDKLVRQKAGSYRSADDRFEVEESATGWFVVDSEQTNDFGQPLMHGPIATLKAVGEALPGFRKTTPLPRRPPPKQAKQAKAPAGRAKKQTAAPKPEPPKSWVDDLPAGEASRVRRLIRALEAEGIDRAEALVRRDREGLLPEVATRLIEARLEALVAEQEPKRRDLARELVRRAAEIVTAEGGSAGEPLPRWRLVEVTGDDEPANRQIVVRRPR